MDCYLKAAMELSYTWVKQGLQGAGLWGADASVERIGNGASGGRCRACCCTSTGAGSSSFRTSVGTT